MTNAELHAIYEEASEAAQTATRALIDKHPEQWFPCGFAWVRIRPARGKFVNYLKLINAGRVDEYEGGYVVYNPSGNSTQWMDAKYAGARAFADVLKKHGIKALAEQRID
jgi:hypothetical protein